MPEASRVRGLSDLSLALDEDVLHEEALALQVSVVSHGNVRKFYGSPIHAAIGHGLHPTERRARLKHEQWVFADGLC